MIQPNLTSAVAIGTSSNLCSSLSELIFSVCRITPARLGSTDTGIKALGSDRDSFVNPASSTQKSSDYLHRR